MILKILLARYPGGLSQKLVVERNRYKGLIFSAGYYYWFGDSALIEKDGSGFWQSFNGDSTRRETLETETVLVTGAGGYIGSKLVQEAAKVFGHVIAAKHTGADVRAPKVTEVVADVSSPSAASALIRDYKPGIVIHLAGLSNARQTRAMIRDTFRANALGTVNILEASVANAVDKFVYCGSMEEPIDSIREIASSPYGASKFVGSIYTRMCSSIFDLNSVIVRPYFVYGPGNQKADKLIPYVVKSFLSGTPPLLGSGDRLMDWVYIDDVVHAFQIASVVDLPSGCEVPVGTGKLFSIRDVVNEISDICQSSVEAIFEAGIDRKKEVSSAAIVGECERLLGWSPGTALKDGLRTTVGWYRDRLEST